jgi:hypothetical protein
MHALRVRCTVRNLNSISDRANKQKTDLTCVVERAVRPYNLEVLLFIVCVLLDVKLCNYTLYIRQILVNFACHHTDALRLGHYIIKRTFALGRTHST